MATKRECPLMTADWLTGIPVPGAPDMYLHMVPLQISSLIKRDRPWRSAARASLYRSRQTGVIGTEFTVAASTIVCFSTWGLAADGCCATAEPIEQHRWSLPQISIYKKTLKNMKLSCCIWKGPRRVLCRWKSIEVNTIYVTTVDNKLWNCYYGQAKSAATDE